MDDFEIDTDIRDIARIVKEEAVSKRLNLKKVSNTCCGFEMCPTDKDNFLCYICGKERDSGVPKVKPLTIDAPPDTVDVSSIKVSYGHNKKIFTVYQSSNETKEIKATCEFNAYKTEYTWISDTILRDAKEIYNTVIIKNSITKKKKCKESIQLACIFIAYQNNDDPKSKLQFATLTGAPETLITKGYNFINRCNELYSLNVIKYNSIELIKVFVDKLKFLIKVPEGKEKDLDLFLLNITNLVKDNVLIHQNKHPSCLASGIILYTAHAFKVKIDLPMLKEHSYMSPKSSKAFGTSLIKMTANKKHPCYGPLNEICQAFTL